MHKITISSRLASKVNGIELSCIVCDVQLEEKNEGLWKEIQQKVTEISQSFQVENISQLQAISASRKAYKACGKDPARYRLSAEALLRRVVKRNEIYQINNVVDLLNLVSISTGFSIGGYDVDKIQGDIIFGIGEKNEPYLGIGRGELNIEFLPVFRDDIGAFGTSTSDSDRTSVTMQTKRFLMIIVDYAASDQLKDSTDFAVTLLKKYARATNFELRKINNDEAN